ncbi:MAG: molybdate ABC transporter substrate-binding protein [Terriglobales bacterium]|jgi:molybdate transport system substrate-binding protein
MKTISTTLFAIVLIAGACLAHADELNVAAASDLNFAMTELAAKYEKQTGTTVKVTFGSSGNFFTQIQNGAPFDMFFAADIDYPKKLEAAGLGEPGTLYQYATGKIVMWVPATSKLDVSKGLALLLEPAVRKISIANPKHAPYGRAAVAAMTQQGIYDKLIDKLVFGENISQATQFVESGNADVGIIALSLAMAPAMADKGRYFEIPHDMYPPLDQGAIVIKASQKKDQAKQFLAYLKNPESVALMQRYGFKLPETVADAPKSKEKKQDKKKEKKS